MHFFSILVCCVHVFQYKESSIFKKIGKNAHKNDHTTDLQVFKMKVAAVQAGNVINSAV